MNHAPLRLVVIGGGLAGLSAAHRILELATLRGAAVELALCEAEHRLGGVIATERDGEYLIEAGADAFLTEKPWALDLCERLGITSRLVATRPAHRRAFVVHRGRLRPLPDGFALLAPARIGPMLRSPLFSWPGKARMMLDLVLPPRPADGDESLARFVIRRLGREVLERAAQPMLAGIYTADPETLSLAATMPRFLELERRYGSVIRGLRRTRGHADRRRVLDEQAAREQGSGKRTSAGSGGAPREGGDSESGLRWSLFATPVDGMEALVSALASRLPSQAIRLGARVTRVRRTPSPRHDAGGLPLQGTREDMYAIELADGAHLPADGVILAAEALHAAAIVAALDPQLSELLAGITYASSAVVTLAYRRDEIAHPLDGFGFVVPSAEHRPILACTFSSVKFPGRAPGGRVLLRAFLGGALAPEALDQDDTGLTRTAQQEVTALLGARTTPHLVRVHRHPRSMPQYCVGHLDRVAAIEARAGRHPHFALAGAAYRGVGIPDCIHSGEDAAERVLVACLTGRVTDAIAT